MKSTNYKPSPETQRDDKIVTCGSGKPHPHTAYCDDNQHVEQRRDYPRARREEHEESKVKTQQTFEPHGGFASKTPSASKIKMTERNWNE
jgi:hypothetical protein